LNEGRRRRPGFLGTTVPQAFIQNANISKTGSFSLNAFCTGRANTSYSGLAVLSRAVEPGVSALPLRAHVLSPQTKFNFSNWQRQARCLLSNAQKLLSARAATLVDTWESVTTLRRGHKHMRLLGEGDRSSYEQDDQRMLRAESTVIAAFLAYRRANAKQCLSAVNPNRPALGEVSCSCIFLPPR